MDVISGGNSATHCAINVSALCPKCAFHSLLVGHKPCFGKLYELCLPAGGNHVDVGIVNKCHEFVAFAVFGYHAPAVVVAVEVQANYAAVVLGFDCVYLVQ